MNTHTSGVADLPEAGCSKHHLIHCSQCRHNNMVRELRAENDRLTTQLAALAAGQAVAPVEKWADRVQRAHPKSEPEFWPDELRVKYMAEEIRDLRAARPAPPAMDASPSAASIAWNALRDATDPLGELGARIMGHVRIFAQRQYEVGRASHGQTPAHVLHLVQDAFAEVAMAYPKAFALHKVGLADTAVRKALATPSPQAAQQAPYVTVYWCPGTGYGYT